MRVASGRDGVVRPRDARARGSIVVRALCARCAREWEGAGAREGTTVDVDGKGEGRGSARAIRFHVFLESRTGCV